jgi:hypothetical protein
MTRTEEEAASAIAVVAAMVAWASMVAWAQGLCLGGARSRMRLAQALALYCGPGHRGSLDGAVALLRWFDVFAVFASESWLDWLPTKGLPSLLNSPLQCVCACLGTNKHETQKRNEFARS